MMNTIHFVTTLASGPQWDRPGAHGRQTAVGVCL